MSIYSSPNSDTQVGDWTTAPLYSQLDETDTPDDTDYISFNGLTGSTACILALSTITAPNLTRGQVSLRMRVRHSGKDGATFTCTLKSSSTTITTFTKQSISSGFVTYVKSLDADELALASSWSALNVTVSYAGTGVCDVSMIVLADEGTQDQMGEPKNEEDMLQGGYCAITGYWYPASMLMWVDGRRVSRKTDRKPDRHQE